MQAPMFPRTPRGRQDSCHTERQSEIRLFVRPAKIVCLPQGETERNPWDGWRRMMNKPLVLHEDDPDLRHLVHELLEDQSYDIYDTVTVEDVLTLAKRYSPCVALIDSTSPTEYDLWHLGPLLEAMGVPAIAFTAHASASRQFELDPHGFIGVLAKPFDANEFIDLVNSICWQESHVAAS
jgi:DNA-binding NtrC family response regulator